MSEFSLMLKRGDVTECTRCKTPLPDSEEFKGRIDPQGSHFNSQGGWWLRIEHTRDSIWEDVEDHDRIGDCNCPECRKEVSKLMEELFGCLDN